MAIIRQKRDKNYSIVSNDILNDGSLSFKARGLLIYMLSKPDDWKFYTSELASHSQKDGEKAIRSALNEIEVAGYLIRKRSRDNTGRFIGQDFILADCPHDQKRHDAKRHDANRHDEKGALLNTDINQVLNKQSSSKGAKNSENAFEKLTEIGLVLSTFQTDVLNGYIEDLGDEVVCHAINYMDDHATHKNFSYLQQVLRAYDQAGVKTIADIEKLEEKHKSKKKQWEKKQYNDFAGAHDDSKYNDLPF